MENENPLSSPNNNPLRCPPAPLNQLSPERMNQQRIPQSPSLHSYLVENDRPRTRDSMTSEVQSKVAFLNSLSTQSSPTRAPRGEKPPVLIPAAALTSGVHGNAWPNTSTNNNNSNHNGNSNGALQRAVMGYEEAQASLATLSAELDRCKEELASRKKRERVIAQRVEMLLEELQADKDKRARDQESYTKEIKRCRKETYRAELALVELREELKEVRSELKKSNGEVQHEKHEKDKSRQEAFERAYALAGVLEEMEQVKDRLKATEKERDAAVEEARSAQAEKTALESARSQELTAALNEQPDRSSKWLGDYEGRSVADPAIIFEESRPNQQLQSFTALNPTFESIKLRLDFYDKQMEGEETTAEEEIEFLKQELKWAERQHKEDEDLIHFMHMQCQFQACPCRIAESNGDRFVHDQVYDAQLQQQRASKKRKISVEASDVQQPEIRDSELAPQKTPKPVRQPSQVEEPLSFPPEPRAKELDRASEVPSHYEDALEIPLPEPQPMELDSNSTTPEATAQLEEITQVLVEPGTSTKPFSFSTSTTSNAGARSATPLLRHTESASAVLEQDLFDLSPPKQAPPRRPSTAMGILTVDSPVRLVPDSPRSVRTAHDEYIRSTTPTYEQHQVFAESTTTTKIALKDSPPRSLHRRAQSKPNIRSHSPLVSSMMSQSNPATMHGGYVKEISASPAASTVFPVTPLDKQSRSTQHTKQYAYTEERHAPQTIATTTTRTTRVPLRGFEDADDVFSPVRDANDHAHTEIIRTTEATSTHTFAHHAATTSHENPDSAAMLTNVPGTPISREAALAQIRARRDRARSVNLKRSTGSLAGGVTAGATAKSPTKPRAVNGITGASGIFARQRDGARREISQASAPGRFAC
ncbi:hypothetical protein LTR84_006759 [Exophiala bonariae]|uniref:Uncharacterized protein n=1 Tax=Exophiala bonariae TaxID=1690606 RepID=A0AAV9N207_9EURO|nr:hypothetical protein LTR84_006759 [Exophiala bonariae]